MPGVWFFSLDANSPLAVLGARLAFHLPYFNAKIDLEQSGQKINYKLRRETELPRASFEATWDFAYESEQAEPGSLEFFLIERYCLYARKPNGALLRCEIHHAPWPLELARAEFACSTLMKGLRVELRGAPLLHFARLQEVIVWAPEIVRI